MCIIISILKFFNKEEVLEWFFEFEFRTLGPKLEREYLKPVTISSHGLEYHIHYFLIPNNSNQISFENTCGKQKTDLIITCVKNLFIDTHIPLQF